MNINDLLNATLDDLEDLPSFEPFPAGAHNVKASFSFKEIEGHGTCVDLKLVLIDTVELADPQDAQPVEGSTCSALFMLDNEIGRGNFKKCISPFYIALDCTSNRQAVDDAKEIECMVVTSVRKDKNDPDRKYLNIREIAVV